jgi:uncharacterized protein (TIGR02421 family)
MHFPANTNDSDAIANVIEHVSKLLQALPKQNLLDQLQWPREVEERFFADNATKLPEVQEAVDREGVEDHIRDLQHYQRTLPTEDLIARWLSDVIQSQIDSHRLTLSQGTREFYKISCEVYGSSKTTFFGSEHSNCDLAQYLLQRLKIHGWDETIDDTEVPLTAQEFADHLTQKITHRHPKMDVEVVLDERTSAKVVAGMTKVRIRPSATFFRWEAEGLWHHEVETHSLTSHNGALQTRAPFLRAGGPRSTKTQEGLAVFSELYNHCLAKPRLERLAIRVKLVEHAENGADFLELYRFLIDRNWCKEDAYLDAQRICRGGLVTGGAPFTKDACYLAGLFEVYAMLAAVARGGFRDEIELLVCGRLALSDIAAMAKLRAMGILQRPKYLPGWLRNWQTLLPFFAFTSFLEGIGLSKVEDHFGELIRVAESARPPEA